MRSCGRHGSEPLRPPFRREPDMRTETSGQCLIHCRVHTEGIIPLGCPGQWLSTAGALQPGHSCPVWANDLCSLTYGLRLRAAPQSETLPTQAPFLSSPSSQRSDLPHHLSLSPTTSATSPHYPSQVFLVLSVCFLEHLTDTDHKKC